MVVNKRTLFLLPLQVIKKYFDKKQIWLIYEKSAQTAQDNGYYFFKYVYENHPEKNIYFIIDKHSPDYMNIKGMKDRVIPFMSIKYFVYIYASKLFVSSEARGHVFFLRKQNGKMRSLINKKKFVFLQHGVLGLKKVNSIFGKNGKNGADLFVTSSEWEKDIVAKNLGYPPDEILVTGLCRWDALTDQSKNSSRKEILLMPTWRSWLDDVPDDKFVQSDYYRNYTEILHSEKLQQLLRDNDVFINFYIHPKFKTYIDTFHTNDNNMKIYQFGEEKVNNLLMRSSLLITDYSSVAWDQYYQKKPVIFYQFDYKNYEQIQGSYIDMNTELFGDRVLDFNELIQVVKTYIDRGFVEKDKYTLMRDNYFQHVDKGKRQIEYT